MVPGVGVVDVAVVTDSTAGLPPALTDRLGITVASSYYDVGAGPLRESEFDGDFTRFYAELDASNTVAKTSPATVGDFVTIFERLLPAYRAVVAVLASAGISEMCANARQAAARLQSEGRGGERVAVFDSAGGGGHQGLQAITAAKAAGAGEDASAVVAAARRARQAVRVWGLLDTLEYLRRAGRIGSAAAWIGSALDLKPILTIESEFKAVERVRTRRRGAERLVELMRQHRAVGADQWFVQHTGSRGDAKLLVDRLAGMFGTDPVFVCEVGPVIATNLGPGALLAGGISGAALYGGRG